MTPIQKTTKRLFDLLAATAGILILFPLGLIPAVLVKLTSRGPILYRQKRVGQHGKLFQCIKFRTMYLDSDKQGSVTTATDSRITPIGRFLRRYKLDELPQLWNVLIGNMSFVGPRPDVPGYADKLEGPARKILQLRPGITGPATIYFRNEEQLLASVGDPKKYNDEVIWPKKVELNVAYLENWSLWGDLVLILRTVLGR